MIELTRSEAVKNGVSVKAELAEGLALIRGDRVQLQQVMLNLIINAIEAMSETSEGLRELLVSTAQTQSGGVLVALRDSGPGLAPRFSIVSLRPSTRPSLAAWAWDWRSVGRSSRRTEDGSGPPQINRGAPRSSSPCLQNETRPFAPSTPAKRHQINVTLQVRGIRQCRRSRMRRSIAARARFREAAVAISRRSRHPARLRCRRVRLWLPTRHRRSTASATASLSAISRFR